jgi:uncharacterized membrane protein
MENYNDESLKYLRAKKQVKAIKGFYIHALVFVLVNFLLLGLKFQKNGEFHIHKFWGIGLWGIGLLAHGLSVFMPNFILGKDWEEKKIRELMDKDKN